MREENIRRLTSPTLRLNDPQYIIYKHLFKDLSAAIKTYAKGDLLDIGCGNKPYTAFFSGLIDSYTGCDVIQSSENLVDILCLATSIPLEDGTKDTVFSTQVIEHVADHQKMVGEAFRILRPGGHFIVSGPMYWEHHEEPYDYFRFTKYGFEYVMVKAGFEVVEIVPNGGKWAMVGQLFHNSLQSSIAKNGFFRRIFKGIYFVFRMKWFISIFFTWLDRVDTDYSGTLNFVVVAKKPKS